MRSGSHGIRIDDRRHARLFTRLDAVARVMDGGGDESKKSKAIGRGMKEGRLDLPHLWLLGDLSLRSSR